MVTGIFAEIAFVASCLDTIDNFLSVGTGNVVEFFFQPIIGFLRQPWCAVGRSHSGLLTFSFIKLKAPWHQVCANGATVLEYTGVHHITEQNLEIKNPGAFVTEQRPNSRES